MKRALADASSPAASSGCGTSTRPSEDTTYTTYEVIARESRREPTIGRPVGGTWVRVLDRELRPVPVGVLGEIYLGGAGLARGYLGRPELTAERFVPDPLSAGGRATALYRTGDLGRYLPDGRIEYPGPARSSGEGAGLPGRAGGDRGGPARAPAGARGGRGGAARPARADQRLVAYVVPRTGGRAVRRRRCARSSARGCPSPWFPPPSWRSPRCRSTPNGKVDRKALPPAARRRGRSAVEPARSRDTDRGAAGADLGARCWAAIGSAPTTTSSSWAATRCSPARADWRASAGRSAWISLAGRFRGAPPCDALARRIEEGMRALAAPAGRSRYAADRPGLPGGAAAALLRPAAALVPRSARTPARRSTTCRSRSGSPGLSTRPLWSAAWMKSFGGMRPCAPPSPRAGAASRTRS